MQKLKLMEFSIFNGSRNAKARRSTRSLLCTNSLFMFQFRPFTIQFMNRNVAVIIISIMSTKARFHTFFLFLLLAFTRGRRQYFIHVLVVKYANSKGIINKLHAYGTLKNSMSHNHQQCAATYKIVSYILCNTCNTLNATIHLPTFKKE